MYGTVGAVHVVHVRVRRASGRPWSSTPTSRRSCCSSWRQSCSPQPRGWTPTSWRSTSSYCCTGPQVPIYSTHCATILNREAIGIAGLFRYGEDESVPSPGPQAHHSPLRVQHLHHIRCTQGLSISPGFLKNTSSI